MAESFTGSNITINGVDDNSSSSITMSGTDTYGTLYGHITTETKADDFIKYKFWVDLVDGDFFDKSEYVYLCYYPQKETIEIKANHDMTYEYKRLQSNLTGILNIRFKPRPFEAAFLQTCTVFGEFPIGMVNLLT